jgi:UDPglucose 6-dehydrogenase
VQSMRRLYHDIKATWIVTDINSAEMIKYASNSFLATKVSFINEVANLCERVDANIDDVILGMGLDPRIGSAYLQPGAGYGGLCLPKDTRALEALASSKGYEFKTLRAAIEANTRQRSIIVDKLKNALGSFKGKEVALLGLAFKPGTDDIANSPAIDIVEMMIGEGAGVRVYDPAAMENARSALPTGVTYAPDLHAAVSGANATVLLTEWPEFIEADWGKIKKDMQEPYIVLDGRNTLDRVKIIDTGFRYLCIGKRA